MHLRVLGQTILGAVIATLLVQSTFMAEDLQPVDPGGWTKAKWGMTPDQVKDAFPQATQIQDMGSPTLGIPGYVIENRKFSAAFGFDKDNHLASVHLADKKTLVSHDGIETPMLTCKTCPPPETGTSKSVRKRAVAESRKEAVVKAEMNAFVVASTKDALLNALREKHGNPTAHTVSDDTDDFEWLFPSTTISLTWFHSEFKNLDTVDIFYMRRKQSTDL
jgi:hypothetical protein